MQIYPGSAIGLGSSPEELQTAWNTVHIHALVENALGIHELEKARQSGEPVKNPHFYKAGAFNASNLSCLFFAAAARVGYDPDIIWEEMRQMILHRGLPNGYLKENPHGIEELNTIPDAVQEMMLQSHEGVLRIFPVWPVKNHPEASFRGFCACGAFEVSASLKDGMVDTVTVVSHKGHPCRLVNPWPGQYVSVLHSYGREGKYSGEMIEISMHQEEKVTFKRWK